MATKTVKCSTCNGAGSISDLGRRTTCTKCGGAGNFEVVVTEAAKKDKSGSWGNW